MIITCPVCGFRHLIVDRQCPVCRLPQGMAWALGRPAGPRVSGGPIPPTLMAAAVLEAVGRIVALLAALLLGALVSALGGGAGSPAVRRAPGGGTGWRTSGGSAAGALASQVFSSFGPLRRRGRGGPWGGCI